MTQTDPGFSVTPATGGTSFTLTLRVVCFFLLPPPLSLPFLSSTIYQRHQFLDSGIDINNILTDKGDRSIRNFSLRSIPSVHELHIQPRQHLYSFRTFRNFRHLSSLLWTMHQLLPHLLPPLLIFPAVNQ